MTELQNTLASEEQKLVTCIHCGLCLEACPTYVLTGDENDGPRGRLYLMRAVGEGRLASTSESFSTHINRCLGCRACEQVCPAGVEYGHLLEASRHELLSGQPNRTITQKIVKFVLDHLWSSPQRLRMFFGASRVVRDLGIARLLLKLRIAELVSTRAHFGLALLESSRGKLYSKPESGTHIQTRAGRESVILFKGCVGDGLFAGVNSATKRVLEANGFEVVEAPAQVCCGALHAHAGDLEGAKRLARQNILAFSHRGGPIITNAGGCGAMLLSYGDLLKDAEGRSFSARIRDVGQQLATVEMRRGVPIDRAVTTYDTSCHLQFGQKAGDASVRMLDAVPDLRFKELPGTERCCGGAGIYNLLEPQMSSRVLEEKLNDIKRTGAQILATGNPGCQMQIGAGACLKGMNLTVCHPVELIDESYQRAGFYSKRRDGEQERKTQ